MQYYLFTATKLTIIEQYTIVFGLNRCYNPFCTGLPLHQKLAHNQLKNIKMKKFIQFSLTAVAFTLMTAFAKADNNYGNINVLSNGIVKVMISDAPSFHNISVSDESGNNLYELSDMKAGSFKNIDFSMVPDGTYYIKVENKRSIETTQVQKAAGLVTIASESDLFVKPIFRRAGDVLNVFFTNPGQKDVEINIYNQNGSVVNTVKTDAASVAKGFDFSKTLHGNYKVVLSQDNYVFSTDFDF